MYKLHYIFVNIIQLLNTANLLFFIELLKRNVVNLTLYETEVLDCDIFLSRRNFICKDIFSHDLFQIPIFIIHIDT